MHRGATLTLFLLAAACWIAAGPGGVTLQALIACRHHHAFQVPGSPHGPGAPQSHDGHPGGPCFCDEMTGGWAVALSLAVPAPVPAPPPVPTGTRVRQYHSPFLVPPSMKLAPESPPPNGLV